MPSSGQIFDGYRLIRPIGCGGFGEVWLCQLEVTGELKAFKFLSSSNPFQLEQELAALIRYRDVAADLNCPNLVTIEHINRTEDGLFYTMPLADGPQDLDVRDAAWHPLTLAAVITERMTAPAWFSAEEIRAVMLPLIRAVQQLNASGAVHRDIKPENILFLRGRPCLGDIGLLTDDTAQITRRGTPGYAAPTWYLESGANPDMWGLATTLYTFITSNNPDKIGRAAFLYPPQGEASVEMSAWEKFHHAIFRATNGDAAERFLYIQDFAKALAFPTSPSQRAPGHVSGRTAHGNPLKSFRPAALFTCSFLAIAMGAGWLWYRTKPAPVSPVLTRDVPTVASSPPNVTSQPTSTPILSPGSPIHPPSDPEYSAAVAAAIRDFDTLYAQAEAKFLKSPPPELERKVQDLKTRLQGKINAPIAEIRPLLDELEILAPQIKQTQISPVDFSTSECWTELSNAAHRIPQMANDERERFRCAQLETKLQIKADDLKTKVMLSGNVNSIQCGFGLVGFATWFYREQMRTVHELAKESHGQHAAEIERRTEEATETYTRLQQILKKCQAKNSSPFLRD